ncbi:MAG: AbrB family transcriptional regulator [Bacillaceae bacterium]|nr:AbrB family transcriptional regulator [Bacillaceae bacterium]
MPSYLSKLLFSYTLGIVGGLLFNFLHLPLPWILGSLTGVMVYKFTGANQVVYSPFLKTLSYVILGIQIGNTFTSQTFQQVTPYFFPYLILSVLLIAFSLISGYILSKKIRVDSVTGMLGAVPGGLSAMIALSDSMKGNTVYVTIFHTVRLLTVLFIVPFAALHIFAHKTASQAGFEAIHTGEPLIGTVLAYPIFFYSAYLLRKRVPANYILIPMLGTAFLNVVDLTAIPLPDLFSVGAQITLGIYLGHSVSVKELVKAGPYVLIYLILSIVIIGVSFVFGYLFHAVTSLDIATSMLSIAPGGLIEMALTAQSAGGDPSIVSSLQTIRVLMIVLLLPLVLQKMLPRIRERD